VTFYDTTVGDCSPRFDVTGHRGGGRLVTHVAQVGGEDDDDCPA
jgi:hypothetical protein